MRGSAPHGERTRASEREGRPLTIAEALNSAASGEGQSIPEHRRVTGGGVAALVEHILGPGKRGGRFGARLVWVSARVKDSGSWRLHATVRGCACRCRGSTPTSRV